MRHVRASQLHGSEREGSTEVIAFFVMGLLGSNFVMDGWIERGHAQDDWTVIAKDALGQD
jgi:hypothetical protein